jgi:hypothetical protein
MIPLLLYHWYPEAFNAVTLNVALDPAHMVWLTGGVVIESAGITLKDPEGPAEGAWFPAASIAVPDGMFRAIVPFPMMPSSSIV